MAWTRFFKSAAEVGGPRLNDVMEGLSRLFEGMGEEEVYRVACLELKQTLRCDRVVLLKHEPGAASRADGDWILKVVGGEGQGATVRQADVGGLPKLHLGGLAPYSEEAAHEAMLTAIALAFDRGEFVGCDVEGDRIALLKDPGPDDDLGSGELSLLAIPLTYNRRVGRVVERARVGVLALYGLPVACDLRKLEGFFRSLIGYAITTPSCSLRDPVTGLYTERHFEDELARYLNMFAHTKQKIGGGLVVGKVDALRLLRQKLGADSSVAPAVVEQRVSEILREVGARLLKLTTDYDLGSAGYRCGVAARLGPDSVGALLPLLDADQLSQWSRRLAKGISDLRLPAVGTERSSLTVSLRILPFGLPGTSQSDAVWKIARECLETLDLDQARSASNRRELASKTADHQVLTKDGWESLSTSLRPPPGLSSR